MKSMNSANAGDSCIAAAGVPARAISCSIRRMAPVAASNVLMGKITILYPSSGCVRHVHWRSTARRGHLMMRQNEARRRTPVLVLLDVRPGSHDRASFERAVEACASIVTAIERADRPVEVMLEHRRR